MKKIISLLSALAIFSSMAVTGFALEGKETATSSNPKVKAEVVSVDEGYARINFVLENNETLIPYTAGAAGKSTYYGINAIQILVNFSPEVFNLAENWPNTLVVGGTADTTGFVYAPTAANAYMFEVPEVLFYTDIMLKDGYTMDNIPSDAITYGECMIEYQGCNNARTYDSYTRYAVNTTSEIDYPLVCTFGDEEEGGEEGGEGEVTLVAGVDEITTEGRHQGKASFSASTGVATTGLTKITVKNSTDADRVEEWIAPTTLGDGITKVLPIVTYNKVADLIGSTFTVEFWNATEVFKTLTYKVQ